MCFSKYLVSSQSTKTCDGYCCQIVCSVWLGIWVCAHVPCRGLTPHAWCTLPHGAPWDGLQTPCAPTHGWLDVDFPVQFKSQVKKVTVKPQVKVGHGPLLKVNLEWIWFEMIPFPHLTDIHSDLTSIVIYTNSSCRTCLMCNLYFHINA